MDVKSFNSKAIDSNFEIVKIREIIEKPPQYGANERAIDGNPNIDYRYIRITDIDDYGNLKEDERKTAEKIENKYIVNENDLLFARSGATAGKCYFVTKNIKGIFAGYMIRFVLNHKKCISKYLFYITFTNFYKKRVEKISRAAAQPNINSQEYLDFEFPLPPLEIQQEIIDKIDSALAEKKNLENKSDEILNSIDDYVLSELGIELTEEKEENNYFIVDIEDIKDGRIDVFYNKPEFKKIEKQFLKSNNVVELKDIIDYVKTGTTPDTKKEPFSNEGIPFLRNTNLQKNEIITDELKYIKDEYKNTLTYSEKDDILICIAGTIGVSSVNNFGKIAINQNVSSLKIKQGISPYFISYLLNTKIFSEFFDRVSSVATIKYINNDNLLSIKIPLPPIEIQDKIANEVKSRIKKADELKKQANEIYEQTKNGVEKMILE